MTDEEKMWSDEFKEMVSHRQWKRNLQNRINRKINAHGWYLHKARGERAKTDVGDYYVLDDNNRLVASRVNIVKFGAMVTHPDFGSLTIAVFQQSLFR